VEFPADRSYYLAHAREVLAANGIDPDSHSRQLFENRLLGSREPIATYALANSLAGFLLGPSALILAVVLQNLLRRGREHGPILAPLALASLPALMLLGCLLLTKGRSAYLGLAVALAVLAGRERGRASGRTIALGLLGVLAVVGALAAAAAAAGQLDRQVLTDSTKSLRYRSEYWRGAWGVITENAGTFWGGRGPGNFGGAYRRVKLTEHREEIVCPPNITLRVPAPAGPAASGLT